MNFRQRFLEISDFLKPYQRIWQNEILLLYPNPLDDYPTHWLKELSQFTTKEDVLALERKEFEGLITGTDLLGFYRRIKELIDIPEASILTSMPEDSFTFLHMIPKKQHEIRRLAPLINELYHQEDIERIIDIGGGIGLLAQTLVNQYDLKVTTLDLDSVMQKTGHLRHEKNAKNPDNKVEFRQVEVSSREERFVELLDRKKMTVGLHTCGPLAVAQISAGAENQVKSIVNFGCCYHKMEHHAETQNISQFAKDHGPLYLSRYALTLSARAHKKMDEKDFDLKQKVKLYRYAIHFLLTDHYGMKDFVGLGNSKPQLYNESFGTYVLEQLSRIGVNPLHSKEELDSYFADSQRQNLISKMLAGGLIRDAMGRLLELYILLDRVIYLEEKGYEAQLLQCFDEVVSPRNLGIFSKLNEP